MERYRAGQLTKPQKRPQAALMEETESESLCSAKARRRTQGRARPGLRSCAPCTPWTSAGGAVPRTTRTRAMRLGARLPLTEGRLQSHADLWLTPLTGVVPTACGGMVRRPGPGRPRAARAGRRDGGRGEDSPRQSMLAVMAAALRSTAEGDFRAAGAAPRAAPARDVLLLLAVKGARRVLRIG
ncbi:hypothetical protein SHJG_p1036 (plasmid) [Streptomyces hygroscopicus subsp. jinggangensis 5008]|nr:hypothetical protein SHJG_p1036 [Streptomyces hygroscopicus subsp. jinggangensis 5008]AGF68321.1 hypothetical protein SHJGH_p1036 [Streptomyces hygroscopicus subsp. jinggangensis TL01]